jgi:hypothetical protein
MAILYSFMRAATPRAAFSATRSVPFRGNLGEEN